MLASDLTSFGSHYDSTDQVDDGAHWQLLKR